MENKVATLLGTSFSSNEKAVTQSDNHLLGSTQKMLVVRFNQQAFEDLLSDENSGPSKRLVKPKKARKVWVRKAVTPSAEAVGDVLPSKINSGMTAKPSVASVVGASPADKADKLGLIPLSAPAHKAKAHGKGKSATGRARQRKSKTGKSVFDRVVYPMKETSPTADGAAPAGGSLKKSKQSHFL